MTLVAVMSTANARWLQLFSLLLSTAVLAELVTATRVSGFLS